MHPSLLDSFGLRLAQLLAARGVNQGEFARRLGASPAFVSDMIRGLKKPGAEFLYRLANQYHVSLDWLIRGQGSMNSENGLDGEWFRAVALRLRLAELAATDNAAAKHLVDELLGNPATDVTENPIERKAVLDELATADKHSTVALSLYQAFLGSPDPQSRLRDVLLAALAHYQSSNTDPLAALLAAREDTAPLQAPGTKPAGVSQLVFGIGNRNAGNDFHEH